MTAAIAPTAPMTAAVNAQPFLCTHRAARRSGGATSSPGDHQPGSLIAPSTLSSQCFSRQRCHADGFVIAELSTVLCGAAALRGCLRGSHRRLDLSSPAKA